MQGKRERLSVRAAGAGGLFIGITGLGSTVHTLRLWSRAVGGLGNVAARAGAVGVALVTANLLDLAAYTALLVVGLRLIRLRVSARGAGLILAVYFIFMAVAQPLVDYWSIQRPAYLRLAGNPPTAAETLAWYWGAGLLLSYAVGLLCVLYPWGRRLPRPVRLAAGVTETQPSRSRSRGARAATNAPRHWPTVQVDAWMPQLPFYGQLAVIGALSEGFKPRLGSEVQLSLERSRLYDDGVFRIPVLVEESGQMTAVFVYSEASAESAAHYSGARTLLRQREGMNAVYYAPEPLAPRAAASVVERLDTPHFSRPEKERPPAEYALWWPTPEEPGLRDSAALAHLDSWFEALDGHWYLLFSSFAKELGLTDQEEECEVYGLPVQPLMLPVDGPGDLALYFHASLDEGLWLAFDVKRTSATLRNRLLAQLADLARNARNTIDVAGAKLPPREEEQARALYFWRRARQEALDAEAQERRDTRVGSIVEVGSARVRWPGASSAEERAAASRLEPGEALTEFVREQLDRALRLLSAGAQQTAPDPDGGPNLHPFVALRKGSDVHHVTLNFFEEPEAMAFCGAIAAEQGSVDMIALVCDGIVRLDDERFDAVMVHAQHGADKACHVFMQRYQLSLGRAETLGNWLLKGTEASLLSPPPPEGPFPEPSPGLAAFVAEIVDTTLAWIRSGDPSGAELYHEREPLFSPALHVRIGNESRMHRFMLGNLAWAQGATVQTLEQSPEASLAVFVYDCVAELNGRTARSLRFHAHERGAACSWLYAQHYEVPVRGRPFQTAGALAFLRTGRPLFPSRAADGPPRPIDGAD